VTISSFIISDNLIKEEEPRFFQGSSSMF